MVPFSCGTNDSHWEEGEGEGSEPLIGTIFSSGKGAINRGPKSETESERDRGSYLFSDYDSFMTMKK